MEEEEDHSSILLFAGKQEDEMPKEEEEEDESSSVLLLANQEEDMAMEEEAESSIFLFKVPSHHNKEEEGEDDDGGSSHRSSDKSTITTEDDRSVEEEPYGTDTKRRKLEESEQEQVVEEEEEEEDESYDSDSFGEYGTDEESDSDEYLNSIKPVEVLKADGQPATDEDIMEMMIDDARPPYEKKRILNQVRSYLKSVDDTEGFECRDYPGFISGVTMYQPRQMVINERKRYPEGYNHLMYMSSLALQHYNEKNGTDFKVNAVEKVTITISMGTSYNLTLTGTCNQTGKTMTFLADVWDNSIEMEMEVGFCRISRESDESPTAKEEAMSEDIGGSYESDLLTKISDLKEDDEKIMQLIQADPRTSKKGHAKVMKKARIYLQSILVSKGFKCTHFPGHISGLTILKPRQKIIDYMGYFPECYQHLCVMAKLAIDFYLKKEDCELDLKVGRVRCANLWKETDFCYTYYLTFGAWNPMASYEEREQPFQAKVHDRQHSIDVEFCRRAV